MEDEIDRKVRERVAAIEREKADENMGLRMFLALLGAGVGWWIGSEFGVHEDKTRLWLIGIGAVLGGIYELLSFAIFVIFVIFLVKCVG